MDEAEASTSNGRHVEPMRSIKSMKDMDIWMKSNAYYKIITFIKKINLAVQGKKLSINLKPSRIAYNLLHVFDALNKMIDKTPTFCNEAYRNWFENMKIKSKELLKEALPLIFHSNLIEVSAYFTESFGNSTRIDYGPCHELAFIMFLCALYKINALVESDDLYVGLKIFNAYLQVVRQLQLTYRMEPAGSHGVSSMYDYQYVSFIWGSAQLSVKNPFEPNRLLETDIIQRYKNEYYFIGYIDHIRQMKADSFAEHSNQWLSTCNVFSWARINSILIGKYEREVLAKFPVIQHLLFGSILELNEMSVVQQLINNQNFRRVMINQLNNSTTVWETILSQLVWLISLVCSGWFSNHSALILWLAWWFWLIWLITRICRWALNTFNRLTPPPSPD